MGQTSKIEWTGKTWNPIRARLPEGMNLHQHKGLKVLPAGTWGYHCEHVSEGCRNCYAEAMNRRTLPAWGTGLAYNVPNRQRVEIFLDEEELQKPLRWEKPTRVFPCSMTDLFAEFVTDEMIDRVFAVMALCPQHTFQVLTKRAERMLKTMVNPPVGLHEPRTLRHVHLGVSVEDQQRADERIPDLLRTPAALRFVSYEPALGPVSFKPYLKPSWCVTLQEPDWSETRKLDWIIIGGESGPSARAFQIEWARDVIAQCKSAGVPVFMKQLGAQPEFTTIGTVIRKNGETVHNRGLLHLKDKKGGSIEEWPKDLRIREMPCVTRTDNPVRRSGAREPL